MKAIVDLIRKDPIRHEALECVYQLELPQCYIAAGFVRNLVWDSLHHNVKLTPLNDIELQGCWMFHAASLVSQKAASSL
ncbi:Uncharacterized protein conserved in bacteria [Vibrio cholerae]|nr:Uncharacterized protein conserved in bacteria [Vibrio cholerae]